MTGFYSNLFQEGKIRIQAVLQNHIRLDRRIMMIIMPVRPLIILSHFHSKKHPIWLIQVKAIKCLSACLHSERSFTSYQNGAIFLQLQPVKTFPDDFLKMSFSLFEIVVVAHLTRNIVIYLQQKLRFFSFHLKTAGFVKSTFISPFPGILCVENVPGAFLGVLSSGRLFPKAVRRSTGMTGNLGRLKI